MWFFFALLSAVFYALLWVLARASRGMPSGVVTMMQFLGGPPLLIMALWKTDIPWDAGWWQLYLLLPLFICPLTSRMLTLAVHGTEVTLVKPLFGLSSFVTLIVASVFFGEQFSAWGVLGIFLTTIGLVLLYHERWSAWRHRGPWLVLAGALIFGANAAVVAAVLRRFPEALALVGISMTGGFLVNGTLSLRAWWKTEWTPKLLSIVLGMAIVLLTQEFFTMAALMNGPSAYVVAVKRTSVLIVAVVGYFFLHERAQSLTKLLLASGLVALGVVMLTVG